VYSIIRSVKFKIEHIEVYNNILKVLRTNGLVRFL